jgi:methanethiol S-methyltransferase
VRLTYAWSSGVLFVVALAYVAYFFVTLTPRPSDHPAVVALALNVGLFGLFAIHHSVMARSGMKRWLARYLPAELERATYVWVASVLLIAVCMLWYDMPGTVYALSGWARGAGVVAQLVGLGIIASAVSVLDPLELAGIRQVLGSTHAGTRATGGGALQIRGPYRWVRHPIYLGWVLAVFGAPYMSSARLSFACVSTAYLVIAIPWEERAMAEEWGEEYRRYKERVRWRVVPGIW